MLNPAPPGTDEDTMTTEVAERAVLRSLLESVAGPTADRVRHALELLLEELGMQVALVAELRGDDRVVTHCVAVPGSDVLPVGLTQPLGRTLTAPFLDGSAGPVEPDLAVHPLLAGHPHAVALGVRAYASVPLTTHGPVRRVLACGSRVPVEVATARDTATLVTVAGHLGRLLDGADGAPASAAVAAASTTTAPADQLGRVADLVAAGAGVEPLSRRLLELLQEATGLDSTYLTTVDWAGDRQHVDYVLNTGDLVVPEGLSVEWSDTLCRRSLDEGRMVTDDVPGVWGDSQAAADLGIRTYVSVPVLDADRAVVGTLCGASDRRVEVDPRHLATMQMFALLIGQQREAEARAADSRRRAGELEARLLELDDLALRDPLTGLSNRAGIDRWLRTVLPTLRPGEEQVALAFCDLDGFKAVNDTWGHAAGDEVLVGIAHALRTVGRAGDLHGRLGGDEFVVAAVLPATGAALGGWAGRLRRAARCAVPGTTTQDTPQGVEVAASVGVVAVGPDASAAEALASADRAMYEVKLSRPGPHRAAAARLTVPTAP